MPLSTLKLHYHQDPGHGWIAVKRNLLIALGIADKISGYSYQAGKSVYCEEDCDATTLLNALAAKQIPYELIRSHKEYTPIRNYESYRP
jgi:hypothetical protein